MTHIATVRRLWKTALAGALCAAAFSPSGLAQVPPPTILQIETANNVLYADDTDPSKFATDPSVTTPMARTFSRTFVLADIQAVNGQRAMGTAAASLIGTAFRTAPTPGQAIADTVRNGVGVWTFEILKSDGTPIGTIVGNGLAGGNAPPGPPLTGSGGNVVITGGTGAFLGARGQVWVVAPPPGVASTRVASMTEDPANRRRNGGGTQPYGISLIPMSVPQIVNTAGGPAVFHSDFSPVTTAKPAKAGEVLIVQATGLGPTVPGVGPDQPFPDTLVQVNSPIDVAVNGKPAEVIVSVGWPGMVDTYRIDVRMPDGATGMSRIRITAAWIVGPEARIAVQ